MGGEGGGEGGRSVVGGGWRVRVERAERKERAGWRVEARSVDRGW